MQKLSPPKNFYSVEVKQYKKLGKALLKMD